MLTRITQSRLVRQFATLLSGRFLAAGIQAISVYLLARWSSVTEFGLFAAALGLAVTLQAIGDAGATTFVVRETALHGVNRNVAYAETLSRLAIGGVAVFSGAVILSLYFRGGAEYLPLLPMVAWLVIERSSDIRSAIARGLGDVRIGTSNIVLRRLAQLALFTTAYRVGIPATWAYSAGLALGSLFAIAVMWRKFPSPPRVPLSRRRLKHAFLRCRPYWVHSAATQFRNIDAALVAAIAGPAQAAFYGIGARLMTPLRMLPSTVATALLPHLTKRGRSSNRETQLGLAVSLVIAVPYALLVLTAPWAVKHLGPEYLQATVPLQIMCGGLAGSSFISIFNAILQARGRADSVAATSVVSALILLFFVSAGAAMHGSVGAAVGFMIATLVQAALVYRQANRNV